MCRGQTFLFMDRRQTWQTFLWIEGRHVCFNGWSPVFFHTWSRPEYLFWIKPGLEYFFLKQAPWEYNGRALILDHVNLKRSCLP